MPLFRSSRNKSDELAPAEALLREVGARLREVRVERGEEIEDVAQYLRIRPTYLYALEQGDLSVVPGRTYALGFLRSYAQYLGFDGDDLIAQIRSSVSDLTGRTRLHVRSPLPESRLPKTPILVLSLAVLAGLYVGWSYVEHSSRGVVEVVAEVPEELQQLGRDAQPEPVLPAPVEPAPVEPGQGEPGAQPDDAMAVAAIEPDLPADPGEDPPAAEPASAGEEGVPAAEIAEPAATLPPAMPADADQAAITAVEPVAEPPAEPLAGPEIGPEAGPDLPSAAAILAGLEPVGAGATAPAIYGDAAATPRVILRARSRSWVHVTSPDGDYAWIETLEPGDAYVVPDRPDLVLWTGNAGGLEVIVDGALLAPLGPDAKVVRDVPLRPGALLSRLLPATAAGPQRDR